MTQSIGPVFLKDEDATTSFARALAQASDAGDTYLLNGDIGAGKSFFSRQFILALLDQPEDIPSPTFTLVQTYETAKFDIWHCDLYRLSGPSDALELGLDEAFDTAVCLIEWPDRLKEDAPKNAINLEFKTLPTEIRSIQLTYQDPKWAKLETICNDFA